VRRLRAAVAGARGAAVRALRRLHCGRAAGLPRLQPAALVHDGALRAVAGGARPGPHGGLEAGRDHAGAPGSRAGRARAAAAGRRGDRLRAGRAGPHAPARCRPAGRARERARALVGPAGRAARATHARSPAPARARRGRPPPQRARGVRGPRRPVPPGARRRRLHDRCDRRRMRRGAATGRCRAGARGDARTDAARSVLCAGAARWQTPPSHVPERGGTRCSFR
jgi:hypothetical protein